MDRSPGRDRRRMDRHRPRVLSAPALRMGRRGGRVLGSTRGACQSPSRSGERMRGVLAPPSRRRRYGGGRRSAHVSPCRRTQRPRNQSTLSNHRGALMAPETTEPRLRPPDFRVPQDIRGRDDHRTPGTRSHPRSAVLRPVTVNAIHDKCAGSSIDSEIGALAASTTNSFDWLAVQFHATPGARRGDDA